jgi:hypothetical protein
LHWEIHRHQSRLVLDAFAKRSNERLQGVISFHEDAIPICGFDPIFITPCQQRAAFRELVLVLNPSVTNPERGFMVGTREFYPLDNAFSQSK